MTPASVAVLALALPPTETLLAVAVERNEALYQNLDVTYRSVYRWPGGEGGGPPPGEIVSTVRTVLQNDRFRVAVTRRKDSGDDNPRVDHLVTAYDGERTRTSGNGEEGVDGPPPPRDAFFPHLWAAGTRGETFPFSAYLAGGDAWDRVTSRHDWFREFALTSWVVGPAKVSGEPCAGVRCDLTPVRARLHAETRLHWLAARKNFLPVRTEQYSHGFSRALPVDVVECGDFRELRPGLWVPCEVSKTTYQGVPLREARLVPYSTYRATVLGAVLNPRHPQAFFRDLTTDE